LDRIARYSSIPNEDFKKYYYKNKYYDVYLFERNYINIIFNFEDLNILNMELESIIIIINNINNIELH
jgi:hypothetical protein